MDNRSCKSAKIRLRETRSFQGHDMCLSTCVLRLRKKFAGFVAKRSGALGEVSDELK